MDMDSPSMAVELLMLADEYMLDHLKQLCEARLMVRARSQCVSHIHARARAL
jgi:hypothetical protein